MEIDQSWWADLRLLSALFTLWYYQSAFPVGNRTTMSVLIWQCSVFELKFCEYNATNSWGIFRVYWCVGDKVSTVIMYVSHSFAHILCVCVRVRVCEHVCPVCVLLSRALTLNLSRTRKPLHFQSGWAWWRKHMLPWSSHELPRPSD